MAVAIVAAAWALPAAFAGTPDEPAYSTPYRLEFDGDNAPSGIRFMMFLQRLARDDPSIADSKAHKLSRAGFREEDLPLLTAYFADLDRQIQQEMESSHKLMVCDDAVAALTRKQLGALWNSFDDIRFGIYAKYFGFANAEMAKLGYTDFPEMLEAITTQFGVYAFENRTINVDQWNEMQVFRTAICAGWDQTTHR